LSDEALSARGATHGAGGGGASNRGEHCHDGRQVVVDKPRIPLLAAMLPDETFGSWLRRCAVSHRHRSVSDFAASILSLEGVPLATDSVDWDCDPPPALVEVLSHRGRLPLAQVRALIVPATSDTLRPRERDAYCPACFQADLKQRAIHRRRDWLNAWTMTCSTHGSLLWSYEQVAHAKAPKAQWRSLIAPEQVRLGTVKLGYVTGFSPHYACWSPSLGMSRQARDLKLSQGRWLDPKLLTTDVGRSLIMLCGSPQADSIYYVLFGSPRSRQFCWPEDIDRRQSDPPATSPRANIRARLTAAYTAAAIWRVVTASRRECGEPFTAVNEVLALCRTREWTDSWPLL
jgi:hypothetical protein